MANRYVYDSAFQNMASSGSAFAAGKIVSAMLSIMPVRSVIDIGCARGTWLRIWREHGVDEIVGVDGDYVDRGQLEIDPSRFVVADLASTYEMGRRFDLAQSLEVAEHLPPSRASSFVSDLVGHSTVVLFSAASPGQGGEHHVNERPVAYWQGLFADHEYRAIDCLRPLLARQNGVPAWYRYNLVLYVHRGSLGMIAPFARQFQLGEDEVLRDTSPPLYKLRKQLIRTLPSKVQDRLARLNARRFPAGP